MHESSYPMSRSEGNQRYRTNEQLNNLIATTICYRL